MAPFLIDMENITEYIPLTVLTRNASTVIATAMDRDVTAIAIQNLTGYKDGKDFSLKFTMNLDPGSSQNNGKHVTGVIDKHVIGNDFRSDLSADASAKAYTINTNDSAGSMVIFFEEHRAGFLNRDSIQLAGNTTYYYEWDKVGSAMVLEAWTVLGGSHISGFPMTVSIVNDIEMSDLYVLSSWNSSQSGRDFYGSVGDMIIDFGGRLIKIFPRSRVVEADGFKQTRGGLINA